MPPHDRSQPPIDAYLAEVAKLLKRRLPAQMAEQRIAEARDHLTERTEELMADGMGQSQAEATAVKTFGPAREWARSVAEAAYVDTGSVWARRIGTIAALAGLTAALSECWFGFFMPIAYAGVVCMVILCLALAIVAFGAFRGRRSASRLILFALVPAAVTLFFAAGSTYVDGPYGNMAVRRAQIALRLRTDPLIVADDQWQYNLLALGQKTYSGPVLAVPPRIPSELKTKDGFIVPKPLVVNRSAMSYSLSLPTDDPVTSAFKEFTPEQKARYLHADWYLTLLARLKLAQAAPARTVATEAEAAREWHRWGQYWLVVTSSVIRHDHDQLMNSRRAAAHPNEFGWWVASKAAFVLLVFASPILLLDYLAAHIGRLVYRYRRQGPNRVGA